MDSKKSNRCVFCEHARDRVDVAGVYCVGGFWKKPDGTCDHYKEYQAETALAGKMDREELIKALRFCEEHWNAAAMVTGLETFGMAADLLENDQRHAEALMAEIESLRNSLNQLQGISDQAYCSNNAMGEDIKKLRAENAALRSQVEQLTNGQAPRWMPLPEAAEEEPTDGEKEMHHEA